MIDQPGMLGDRRAAEQRDEVAPPHTPVERPLTGRSEHRRYGCPEVCWHTSSEEKYIVLASKAIEAVQRRMSASPNSGSQYSAAKRRLVPISCKSLFALVIKIFPGCRRAFRVKMWGTSSPNDKLTGDLGNVIESTKIGGRRLDCLMAGKLSPSNFGLLQHYLPQADLRSAANSPSI